MLMLPLLWKSMTSKLGSSAMISLPVTVAFSHAIFLLPLALVLTARYFLVRFSDSLQEQVGWGTLLGIFQIRCCWLGLPSFSMEMWQNLL